MSAIFGDFGLFGRFQALGTGSFGTAGGPRALVRPRASRGPSRMVRHGGGGRGVVGGRGEARHLNFREFREGKDSLIKS